MKPATSRYLTLLAILVVGVATVLRFARPDLLFLFVDEGLLFKIVDESRETGIWPSHGIAGTKGFVYGPVPVSVYLALSYLSPDIRDLPTTAFYFQAIFQLITLIFALSGLRRVLSGTAFLLVSCLIFTSPHLLFYSRMVWDNIFLIGFTNIFAGILFRMAGRSKSTSALEGAGWMVFCGLLGAMTALTLGTHLMAAPLVLAMLVFALLRARTPVRAVVGGVIWFGVMGLMLYGYVHAILEARQLTQVPADAPAFAPSKLLTGFRDVMMQWSGWVSWWEFARYFGGNGYERVIASMAGAADWAIWFLLSLGRVAQVFWIIGMIGIPVYLVRGGWRQLSIPAREVAMIASIMFMGHLGMSLLRGATTHPHYFQAVWWVPFVIIAVWFDQMPRRSRIRSVVMTSMITVILINMTANVLFAGLIQRERAYEGAYLVPGISRQWQIVRETCQNANSGEITLPQDYREIPSPTFQWLARHTPECAGISVIAPEVPTKAN